ncbi:MAG: rRNA maturation RNase YbeY [Vicinamibacterales bacterium]
MRLRVAVSDERGRPRGLALGRWLATVAPARARGIVNVALVSDARIRALNRQFRGKDTATDVLSFPADESADSERGRSAIRHRHVELQRCLGDIVIARGVAARQARLAGHSEATEHRVLALHGLLHLLGYDHENAHDDGAMARVERRLRRRGGLKEGLIERA